MKHAILSIITLSSLTACAQLGFEPDVPRAHSNTFTSSTPVIEDIPAPKVPSDLISTINDTTDPSVTVYPLTGAIGDPYTRKNLQPISSKVLAEGYPVLDPSVSVYPIRPPSAVPPVAFENVNQVGASSSLYSARVQSLTAQREIEEGAFPNFPSTNKIITDVQSEALLPLPIEPLSTNDLDAVAMDAPPPLPFEPMMPKQAPVPVFDVFKKPGTVSRPEGALSTANSANNYSTVISYDEPWPITRPENTNIEALNREVIGAETLGVVPAPPKPSIDKIDSGDGSSIPSLTSF